MKKRELLAILHKEPSAEMIREAKEDKLCKRETEREDYVYRSGVGYVSEKSTCRVKSYGTRIYFTVKKEKGILVLAVFTRKRLAAGNTLPYFVTYIDPAEGNWLNLIVEEKSAGLSALKGKWTEAYSHSIIRSHYSSFVEYVDWGIAKDIYDEEDLQLIERELKTAKGSMLKSLDAWQEKQREEGNIRKAQRRADYWQEQMDRIPALPEDFDDWVWNEGTLSSNFLLYKRKGTKTEVYCTHCESTYTTAEKMLHNPGDPTRYDYKLEHWSICPKCRARLATKAWGKQKYLETRDRVVIMQSAGEHIAFRGFEVVKRFRLKEDLINEDKWTCHAGLSEDIRVLANRYSFNSEESYRVRKVQTLGKVMWAEARASGYYSSDRKPFTLGNGIPYTKNISDVLEGTGVRPAVAEVFMKKGEEYLQSMLQAAAKKPYVEYLLKAGLKNYARQVAGETYAKIVRDEKASNLRDLIGLDGQQLYELRQVDGGKYAVKALQYVKKHHEKLSRDTLRDIERLSVDIGGLNLGRTGMTLQRMFNYLQKQAELNGKSFDAVNRMYSDYLKMAQERGMDLKDEIVCHTSKLKEMHDRYLEEKNARDKAREKARVDKKFGQIEAKYQENADHFAYQRSGLVIVVPKCASDIKAEGREQHHCVGASDTYMDRMNRGQSFILFLRKVEDPEKPYYTLEVDYNGKVLQSYGAYDRKPNWKKVEPVLQGFTRHVQKKVERAKWQQVQEGILTAAV